jgi:hypothetical protein
MKKKGGAFLDENPPVSDSSDSLVPRKAALHVSKTFSGVVMGYGRLKAYENGNSL